MDPAEERRVAHVDRDVEHFIECEEHRYLQKDRHTARNRVHLLLLVQVHEFLLLAHLVVFVALADLLHLRLQLFHLCHRGELLVGEREEGKSHEHGEDQNGDAEVVHDRINGLQ